MNKNRNIRYLYQISNAKKTSLLLEKASTAAEKAKKAVEQAKLAQKKARAQLWYLNSVCEKVDILLYNVLLATDKAENVRDKANDLFTPSNSKIVEINSAIDQSFEGVDKLAELSVVLAGNIVKIKNIMPKICDQLDLAKKAEKEEKTAKAIAASNQAIAQLKKVEELVKSQQCDSKLKLAEEQAKLAEEKANFGLAKAAEMGVSVHQ